MVDKTVLVRVDFNVPIQSGKVLDDTKIREALSTVKELRKQGAKVILMSHLGKGGSPIESLSLRQLIPSVEKIYEASVVFIEDYVSESTLKTVNSISQNSLILLENLRFYPEESSCDLSFAKKLADLGDFF